MITQIQMPATETITDEDIQKMRDQSERQAGYDKMVKSIKESGC